MDKLKQLLNEWPEGSELTNEESNAVYRFVKYIEARPTQRVNGKEVDKIYKSYSTRCVISGRSLGKCSKDKNKIKALLKQHTAKYIIDIQDKYKADCLRTGKYMKDYGTFLNRLPDPEQFENLEEKKVW